MTLAARMAQGCRGHGRRDMVWTWVCEADGARRRRRTSASAGARATTPAGSTSASGRRSCRPTTRCSPPRPVAEPFVHGDARHMDAVDDGSVALVVTSPPYFAGKQYEEELEREGVPSSYLEYLELLTDVFAECVRTLEPGGRIAVNVANLGRKPYRSLSADVIRILEHDLGLLLRGEIIWQKGEGASGSCAWGSFRSAANPVLRDVTERVIVASKGRFDRARPVKQRAAEGLPQREHDHDRRLPRPDARRVVDPGRERPARRPPGAVPRRAARAADPPVHVRRRPRPRPVHGQRLDARRRRPARPALRRLRPRRRGTSSSPATASTRPSCPATGLARRGARRGCVRRQPSPSRCSSEAGFTIEHRDRRMPGTAVSADLVATDAPVARGASSSPVR